MPGYFSYFPKLIYTFDKNTINQQSVTNILARSTFLKEIATNASVYFKYQIKESDTPEIIADKIYGDPYRSWIILLFNNIINPNYDWPMNDDVLNSFVANKYNQTLDEAKSEIHHYEKQITNTIIKNGMIINTDAKTYHITEYGYNFLNNSITNIVLPTVADTTINVSTETTSLSGGYTHTSVVKITAVSNFTNEAIINENKRSIKLLDPAYAQQVEEEFKRLMR